MDHQGQRESQRPADIFPARTTRLRQDQHGQAVTGWLKPPGDEFIPPDSGPGPVRSDPAHPYVSNAVARQETVKIADLTNPILKPWVVEQMKKANDEVIAGKVGFTARSRCWPHGVPGFLLYPVHPIFFIQTPKEVVMSWGQDFQMRRVYLNVPHSTMRGNRRRQDGGLRVREPRQGDRDHVPDPSGDHRR
jgi:hypothetical protein